jgi:predicted MFS family arabinose efflux permease
MPVALALIGDLVAMDRRQVALSRFMVAVIAGQLVGSTLSGFLAGFVGWRGVFGIAALLAALAWIALWRGLAPSAAPVGRVDFGAALTRYRLIAAKPRARALFALVFVDGVVFFGLFPYVALLLEARRQGGPVEAGIVIAGFAIGGLLYAALVVWLLRRLGLKGMLPTGGIIGAAAFLVFAIGGHWTLDAVAMLLLGVSFYMLHNSFQAQVSEVFPEARGSVMALHAFSYFCGQALSVVVLGFLLNAVGLVPAMVLLAAGSIALGLAAGRILTKHPPPPPAQPRAR